MIETLTLSEQLPSQTKVTLLLQSSICHFPLASIFTQFMSSLFPIGPDCPFQLCQEREVSSSLYLNTPSFTMSVTPNQDV